MTSAIVSLHGLYKVQQQLFVHISISFSLTICQSGVLFYFIFLLQNQWIYFILPGFGVIKHL